MEVIAECKLICRKRNGERIPVTLRLGKPFLSSDVDWACPVAAEGLYQHLTNIHGVDSFQALVLAQGLLRNLMQGEIESGSTFHWPESGEQMSIEDLFGKAL